MNGVHWNVQIKLVYGNTTSYQFPSAIANTVNQLITSEPLS